MKIINSSLYKLSVMHSRILPSRHQFKYSIFMFYIDLDELSEISCSSFLVGFNKRKLYSFYDSDHFEPNNENIKTKLFDFLKNHGINTPPAKVMLLTNLRVFGYVFNPVSFYFCYDTKDSVVAAVAEVGNTFAERKIYFLSPSQGSDGVVYFRSRQKKEFYVSPFSPLDLEFDFELSVPDKTLSITINDYIGAKCTFSSSLTGVRTLLSDKTLLFLTLRHPFITFTIIFLIHWQAFLLYLKRTPFFLKEDNPEKQNDVINPHKSLTSGSCSFDKNRGRIL